MSFRVNFTRLPGGRIEPSERNSMIEKVGIPVVFSFLVRYNTVITFCFGYKIYAKCIEFLLNMQK